MNIRRAEPTDALRMRQLHRRSVRSLCRDYYTPRQIEAWTSPNTTENCLALIRDFTVFVAEEGKRWLGFAALDSPGADVRALYVAPEAAGKV